MKRLCIVFLSLFIILNFEFLILNSFPVVGQERYATCDLCGYCPPNPPPTNWEKCRSCLYESASPDPSANDTLRINDENIPPTPIPGRWNTMIGCISTNGGFQQEGAAASLVQVLLNLIFSGAGVIALVYFIYGSFIVLTSQAEPEKINHGKRIISGAIIGVLIALGSVFLVNLIASGFLKIPGIGG